MKVWYFSQLIEFKPIVGFEFKFLNDLTANMNRKFELRTPI
jgi:hypothetical protein